MIILLITNLFLLMNTISLFSCERGELTLKQAGKETKMRNEEILEVKNKVCCYTMYSVVCAMFT